MRKILGEGILAGNLAWQNGLCRIRAADRFVTGLPRRGQTLVGAKARLLTLPTDRHAAHWCQLAQCIEAEYLAKTLGAGHNSWGMPQTGSTAS